MSSSSTLIDKAVEQLSKFPGIGKKSALRMALYLLKRPEEEALSMAEAMTKMRTEIKYCKQCFNLSDGDLCNVCQSPSRDAHIICVVKDFQDVLALENTGQYSGHYHVLGGLISPIDGIGPSDIKIPELITRVQEHDIHEIIVALSATMEGDTTEFYIARKMQDLEKKVSTLAKGISVGGELEYADQMTLARSLQNRVKMDI
ncbi:MAG: recombination protein RecR [Bacteroidia bacterium]